MRLNADENDREIMNDLEYDEKTVQLKKLAWQDFVPTMQEEGNEFFPVKTI